MKKSIIVLLAVLIGGAAFAQQATIVKNDMQSVASCPCGTNHAPYRNFRRHDKNGIVLTIPRDTHKSFCSPSPPGSGGNA
jgi:hypothetical protein